MQPAAQMLVNPETAEFLVLTWENGELLVSSEDARTFRWAPPVRRARRTDGVSSKHALQVVADELIAAGFRRTTIDELPVLLAHHEPWRSWRERQNPFAAWCRAWGAPAALVGELEGLVTNLRVTATTLEVECGEYSFEVHLPASKALQKSLPDALGAFVATHAAIESDDGSFSAGVDVESTEDGFTSFLSNDLGQVWAVDEDGRVVELREGGDLEEIDEAVGPLIMRELLAAITRPAREQALSAFVVWRQRAEAWAPRELLERLETPESAEVVAGGEVVARFGERVLSVGAPTSAPPPGPLRDFLGAQGSLRLDDGRFHASLQLDCPPALWAQAQQLDATPFLRSDGLVFVVTASGAIFELSEGQEPWPTASALGELVMNRLLHALFG